MSDALVRVLAFGASLGAMLCFALAYEAHWKRLLRTTAKVPRRRLMAVGVSLGAVALGLVMRSESTSVAFVIWTMMLTVAGILVAVAGALVGESRRH